MAGKRSSYIIAVIAMGIIASVFAWEYTFRKSAASVSHKKADFEIGSSILLQEFETDENEANELYLDKILLVHGPIESVSKDSIGISVYLKETNAMSGVICSFDKNAADVGKLNKGAIVKIKGICSGYLMDVVLNKCSLESDSD
jgi:hypothetical protein